MLIRFNNDDRLYNLMYHNAGRLITLSNFIDELPEDNTSGFSLIDDFDNETILEDHSNHTIIYNRTDNSIVYANNYIDYYIVFLLDKNKYVIGYTVRRDNKLYNNEILYKTIPEPDYNKDYDIQLFDEDGFCLYKVVDDEIVPTTEEEKNLWIERRSTEMLESARSEKIREINNLCNTAIITGIDYNGEHFSYSLEDQNNIDNLLNMTKTSGGMDVPYHADGANCRLYSAEDVFAIYIAQKTNVTHHTTYANQLKQYVNTLETVDDVQAVTYGQELTGQYLETYNAMMTQAQAIIGVITTTSI